MGVAWDGYRGDGARTSESLRLKEHSHYVLNRDQEGESEGVTVYSSLEEGL